VDAGRVANSTHRRAGDNARTGSSRDQNHVGGAVATFDHMRDRLAVERDGDHAPHAFLACLFDAGRHFVRLAVTPAKPAFTVTNDDHRGEAEATTAFYHRGAPLDLDDVFRQLAFDAFGGSIAIAFTFFRWCHMSLSLEAESAFTG